MLKAKKADDDVDACLSVLSFQRARTDTKDHKSNAPHLFVSASFAQAFDRAGILDVKAFLTNIAYRTWSEEDDSDRALIASLKEEVARLSREVSVVRSDNARLKNEVAGFMEKLNWYAFLVTKLQEVA